LEARKAGYEPVLFGYTDTSLDPLDRDPNDPALTSYDKGVMPGFSVPLHLPDDMGPWIADLVARGYDLPNGREDAFRPRKDFDRDRKSTRLNSSHVTISYAVFCLT